MHDILVLQPFQHTLADTIAESKDTYQASDIKAILNAIARGMSELHAASIGKQTFSAL